ncbi:MULTISPECIES: HAD family hydrolase [unclassified Modicisalibacter]|uniref:HAD family hydrolase n=1 Tax=unclassified Modicisalibacter TaxID=2679913 RepID=UPI001CCC1BAA|nr:MULTISPECIES: HAD family hydrolase [unclassified Modicisalibacter]MBZ9557807.1 HAD family hydrolase [Modicisalibacter sp. R2A 31.J]MBZ9573528.1 HAD family hydrolase [Modicisalibacter sp. MOD 31.J]
MSDAIEPRFDALVFDCDGVILDSAGLKRSTFADFYRDQPPALHEAILAYLARGGGQPRDVKFHHIEAHILGRPVDDKRIRDLSTAFAERIESRVAETSALPGAVAFLERWQGRLPLYLLSATPQAELRRIIAARGLDRLFDDVLGAPPDKVNGLRNLLDARGHAPARTVMIGDSYNDYRAARSNGTHFVGILAADAEHSPFPAHTVTQPDLIDLEASLARLPDPAAD